MKLKIFLILIIILAFSLRVFKVGEFPVALYGDEQAFAWNAYNILKLGQDEYGNPYPWHFRSFDDYKSPIPAYLLVPFLKVLGMNTFSIRLPVVIASTLTVLATYLLVRLFLNKKTSLLVAFLLSISPWHIHLARGFFEVELSLLFFVFGVYFFLKSKMKLSLMMTGMLFFGFSLYSYLTPRILLSLFLPFLLIYYFIFFRSFLSDQSSITSTKTIIRRYVISLIFLLIISLPLIKLAIVDKGIARFDKLTTAVNKIVIDTVNRERNATNLDSFWRVRFHNKYTIWARLIETNYLEHLSSNFWYITGDNNLRVFTGNMGMFYLIEFPFLLIGLYYLWKDKRIAAILFLGWLLLSPIPSSIVGRPFGVRSLFMLPAPYIFVGFGLYKALNLFQKIRLKQTISMLIVIGFTITLGSQLIGYFFEYPVYAATWWGWENKAALEYAAAREANYDKIFISDFYSGATLAYAVYNSYDPLEYRQAINNPIIVADGRHMIRLGKYYFGSLDLNNERLAKDIIPPKSLYIGRPEEPMGEDAILAPDDKRVLFVIHDTLRKENYKEKVPAN